MNWLFKKRSAADRQGYIGSEAARREAEKSTRQVLWEGVGLVVFFVLISVVGFAGLKVAEIPFFRDQVAQTRIVAEFPFEYQSQIRTEELIQRTRDRVVPVYRIEMEPFQKFERFINLAEFEFSELEAELSGAPDEEADPAKDELLAGLVETNRQSVSPAVLQQFFESSSARERKRLLLEGLSFLRQLYENGMVGDDDPNFTGIGSYNLVPILLESGERRETQLLRVYDAQIALRGFLASLNLDEARFGYLTEILRAGLVENLVYDLDASQARRQAAVERVNPVVKSVRQGDVIIDAGVPVSALALEKLSHYRELQRRAAGGGIFGPLFVRRAFFCLIAVFAAVLVIQTSCPRMRKTPLRLAATGVMVAVNVVLFRLTMLLGDAGIVGGDAGGVGSVFPYAAPVAFAPIALAILLAPSSGIIAAGLLAFIYSLMMGESLGLFIASLSAALAGVHFCRDIRVRTNVVRASLVSGVVFAAFVTVFGVFDELSAGIIGRQVTLCLVTGFTTGVVVLGVLPVLEKIFQFTTDITLLEFTDYNHPLLRKLQVEAPGSYHHSLMVASLAENAAADIGANALLCRSASLYHDIGKMVKPEYFTENQRSGHNPLIEQKPSMSAVIIKSHVKEGVEMARENRLPKIFIDVIRQHHGTSLIQYFYHEAMAIHRQQQITLFDQNGLNVDSGEKVDESTYRYDGPKPQFVESAIILLADSVEAASRSLRKVNAQNIDELLESIFRHKIEDGQLDDSGITLTDLARVRKSFSRTLLNSLHSRVQYPAEKGGRKVAESSAAQADEDETPDPDQRPV